MNPEEKSQTTHRNRRTKRNKLEIYFDVLSAISDEATSGEVKPTRIQYRSNLSYDNLVFYLQELETKQMLIREPISLTPKGKNFLGEYSNIREFVKKLGLEYL